MGKAVWTSSPNIDNAVVAEDGTDVDTTTTETIVFPNITIPANTLQDERALRIRAFGKYGVNAQEKLTFKLRFGGVSGDILCKSAAIDSLAAAGQTDCLWMVDILLSTRSNGATGSVVANGVLTMFSETAAIVGSATGAPAIAPMTVGGQTAPAAVTLDLTADVALSLTVDHETSHADNTVTGLQWNIESAN